MEENTILIKTEQRVTCLMDKTELINYGRKVYEYAKAGAPLTLPDKIWGCLCIAWLDFDIAYNQITDEVWPTFVEKACVVDEHCITNAHHACSYARAGERVTTIERKLDGGSGD